MQASSDARWLLGVLETVLLGAISWFFLVNGVVILVIQLFPLAGTPEYENIGIVTLPGAPILGAVSTPGEKGKPNRRVRTWSAGCYWPFR
jgi:hypothetical protein